MKDLLDRPRPATHDRPPIDPRIAQRWVEARRQEGRRRLRILIGTVSVLAVAGLAGGSLFSPLFEVKHVRFHISGSGVGAARVEAEGGLAHHPLMIELNPAAVAARLDADPLLGGARVAKHWPGTVTVSVDVRSPVAQVPAGSSSYVPVDATGRVLGPPAAKVAARPVITGVGAPPALGGWLSGSAGPTASPVGPAGSVVDMAAASDAPDVPHGVAGALAFVQALPLDLRPAIDTITTGSGPNISVVVSPPRMPAGTLTVQLGDGSQLAAKVTALVTLLDQADLTGVSSIDLSVPSRPAATLSQPGTSAAGTGQSVTGQSGSAQAGTGQSGAGQSGTAQAGTSAAVGSSRTGGSTTAG